MFTKRTLLGAVCSLVLVGEVIASFQNGLFTIPGIVVFFFLYSTYFLVVDAFYEKYKPSIIYLVLFNFALYSVLITGFLHGELLNFLKPDEVFITTLIRIQSALFLPFVFPIVNRLTKRTQTSPTLRRSLVYFLLFVMIMSLSEGFGLKPVFATFRQAPMISFLFTVLGAGALLLSLRAPAKQKQVWPPLTLCIFLFAAALIPNIIYFLIYAPLMIISFLVIMKADGKKTKG